MSQATIDRRTNYLTRARFQELREGIWQRHDLSQSQKERIDEEMRIYFGGGITSGQLRSIIQDVIEKGD